MPEVETIVRDIRPLLIGKMITGLVVRPKAQSNLLNVDAQTFYEFVMTQTVTTVVRKGKYIIMPLENNSVIVMHLGMTGKIWVSAVPDVPFEERFTGDTFIDRHSHFIMEFSDPSGVDEDLELQFNDVRLFGNIWLVTSVSDINNLPISGLKDLGPDALGIESDDFYRIMRTRRSVKAVLLDQSKIAGVGNIYSDEACFSAGIHPSRKGESLSKEERVKLWLAIKTVLKQGLKYRGSSISDYTDASGAAGSFQNYHKVYQKKGQKCTECTSTIEKIKLSGRSTHFCPSCQREGE